MCTRFNREEGCKLPCNFQHACLFCESRSHAKRDCIVYKKTKDGKQEIFHSRNGGGKSNSDQDVNKSYALPLWCVGPFSSQNYLVLCYFLVKITWLDSDKIYYIGERTG